MKTVTDISVIIPIHEFTEVTFELFKNAVKSISDQKVLPNKVLFVIPKSSKVNDTLKTFELPENLKEITETMINKGDSDFCSQVNLGAEKCNTKFFSVLEIDDEYSAIWFKNSFEYIEENPDTSIFLPIVIEVNENNQFIGFTNETLWATDFSEETGYLDNNTVMKYQNFSLNGAVIKTSDFLEVGSLKPSIKLSFVYEFLLRATYKAKRIMTIPKFGYKHMNQRSGSLFRNYKEEMNPVEANWWLSLAKREYLQPKDRKITYDEQTV
jgi:hypothetical protein